VNNLGNQLAHLVLVPNPPHNEKSDFGLEGSLIYNANADMFTFSGIGYYNPKIFKDITPKKAPLATLLRKLIEKKEISGELYEGIWHDIGTPKRLKEINENF